MQQRIKNGNGEIKNLKLFNDILKKFVYDYQLPIAAAKHAALGTYRAYLETNNSVDQIIADNREWAQDWLPDPDNREKNEEGIENVDLFLQIVQKLKRRGYPYLDAKIQAYGIYGLIFKEGWKDTPDAIIDSSDWYAMETLPDLRK